jgi:hypothetical protein
MIAYISTLHLPDGLLADYGTQIFAFQKPRRAVGENALSRI